MMNHSLIFRQNKDKNTDKSSHPQDLPFTPLDDSIYV